MNGSLPRRSGLAAALLTAALGLGACAPAGAPTDAAPRTPSPGTSSAPAEETIDGELTVFAAASLSGAFDELAAAFEQAHPGVDVRPISYDGSSVLATQIIEGAAVDVFASADEKNMAKITDAGLATTTVPFATNVLQIAVPAGNPEDVQGLADLADPTLTVVTCAAEVPCGNAAHTLLDAAGVTVTPASEEQNVTAVLAKVRSGEADAGLVYRTDVAAAAGEVDGIDIDGADQATNVYPLTVLDGAANSPAATAFVDFVLSPDGQAVLADFGFGAP